MTRRNIFLVFFIVFTFNAFAMQHRTIMDAAQAGDLGSVQIFLDAPFAQTNENGDTALILAAKNGHELMVKFLLAHGASVNQANNNGSTALTWAAQKGHDLIVKLLLAHNGSINCVINSNGSTALICAACFGRTSTVKLLLAHGASVTHVNNFAATALTLAAENAHESCCITLINRMLKIPHDAQRSRLYTFLLCMKQHGLVRDIRGLLKPYLLHVIESENRENGVDSVAWQEIEKINKKDVKEKLMAMYWPEYLLSFDEKLDDFKKPDDRKCILQ